MQSLRNAKLVAGLVLAWFALFLGSSVAGTVVATANLHVVCSGGGGLKTVDLGGDDGEPQGLAGMNCPLCAALAAPPPACTARFEKPSELAYALQPIPAAILAAATAPPLPSRGPPAPLR